MIELKLKNMPSKVKIFGRFDKSCICKLSPDTMKAIQDESLKLSVIQMGKEPKITKAKISVESTFGRIAIFIGADSPYVYLGVNTSGFFHFRLWRRSRVRIENNTTANGLSIVCDKSDISIGADCMFSDEVLIQSADQHGIVDLESGKIINNRIRKTCIGEHVWVGRKCTLLPDTSIGFGSVIGAGAIISNNIPETCVAAGVPAKVVKTKTTWSRFPNSLDTISSSYIEKFHRNNEYFETLAPADV